MLDADTLGRESLPPPSRIVASEGAPTGQAQGRHPHPPAGAKPDEQEKLPLSGGWLWGVASGSHGGRSAAQARIGVDAHVRLSEPP